MLTTISEAQQQLQRNKQQSKNPLFRQLHKEKDKMSNKYLSNKVSKVVMTVDRTQKKIDQSIQNLRSVQEVTSNFYFSDIKPKIQNQSITKEQIQSQDPSVQHLMDHPLINRQNPQDSLKEEKELMQKLLIELEEQKVLKMQELEEAKLLKKLQGGELGSIKDIFSDQKNKLVTMIQIAQCENEAIELNIQRTSQSMKQLNDTRDDSNKIMQKYTKEVQRLKDNIHLMEKKNMADLKLVQAKIRQEEDNNKRLREDFEKAQVMLNEDEIKRKEYYILSQENENLELQIKSLQQTYEHHIQEFNDLQQEYQTLLRVEHDEELRAQNLINQAKIQQEKSIHDKSQLLKTLHQDSIKLATQIQRMKQDKSSESSLIDQQINELVLQGQQLQNEFTQISDKSRIKHEDLQQKLKDLDSQQNQQEEKLAQLNKIKEEAKRLQKGNRDQHDIELQSLRQQIETSKDQVEKLENEAKKLTQDKEFYEKQLTSDQTQTLNNQLDSKTQTVEILKKQKDQLTKDIELLESELTDLQEKQELLDSEEPHNPKQELESQIKLKNENEKTYNELQEQIKSLKQQIDENDEMVVINKMQYDKSLVSTSDMDKKELLLRERIRVLEEQYQVKQSKNKKKK